VGVAGSHPVSTGAQINFGDLPPYFVCKGEHLISCFSFRYFPFQGLFCYNIHVGFMYELLIANLVETVQKNLPHKKLFVLHHSAFTVKLSIGEIRFENVLNIFN
jgi:hypothetical protein